MDLLEGTVRDGARVVFTHFNNTNPAPDGGEETGKIRRRGFEIAQQGMRFPL
jgi:hypothetical protein